MGINLDFQRAYIQRAISSPGYMNKQQFFSLHIVVDPIIFIMFVKLIWLNNWECEEDS